jgi:2-oxoglutarate ferredoxin oxidoreductase subunit alpha
MGHILLKGNQAIAEAAVRAGCKFYSGYPITPQTDVLEYLSWRMEEAGGTFIQSESELSAVAMVYGAASSGVRALATSAGCGFTLMLEGISYLAAAWIPAVFVNVMRYGIGLGEIHSGQDAYWQAVKGGGHGDFKMIVLAPNSVQEIVDMTYSAFDKAEEYRTQVLILLDASLGQLVEACHLPDYKDHDIDTYDWSVKGSPITEKHKRIINIDWYDQDFMHDQIEKHRKLMAFEQRWESLEVEDAEVILTAYGTPSRVCMEAVQIARERGIKLGLIRPISLWPFPRKAFKMLNHEKIKGISTVELNLMSQMKEDVIYATGNKIPVYSYCKGDAIPNVNELILFIEDIIKGDAQKQEVY